MPLHICMILPCLYVYASVTCLCSPVSHLCLICLIYLFHLFILFLFAFCVFYYDTHHIIYRLYRPLNVNLSPCHAYISLSLYFILPISIIHVSSSFISVSLLLSLISMYVPRRGHACVDARCACVLCLACANLMAAAFYYLNNVS